MTTKIAGTTGVEFPDTTQQATAADLGPAFGAYTNATLSAPDNSVYTVALQAEHFDTANCYNPANGRFTPNVAGYYMMTGCVSFNSTDSTKIFTCMLSKNGANIISGSSAEGGTSIYAVPTVSGLIYMNGTTDYVVLAVYHNAGASVNIVGDNQARTTFTGFLARRA